LFEFADANLKRIILKPELVIMRAIYEPAIADLEQHFTVHRLWLQHDPAEFLRAHGAKIRAAVTTTPYGFSLADFASMPQLEMLACFGPYYTLIDRAEAKRRNIKVTHTPDSTAEPVADLALGLIIAVMRRLCESDRFVRAGKWAAGVFPAGVEVRGKTCGIVGCGRIGREIAKRAAAFDMPVCYHGPRRKEDVALPYYADLEQMAREVDCLVVTCALTETTRNLVDARILQALGKNGFLVNVARGAIVDEDALIVALQNGTIAGAALDVFRDEPQVPAALRQMDNVVLAAHIGTSTREVREGRHRKFMTDVRAWLEGRPLSYPVPL
jgi:lactate dehydrogenase-like 2-hydroxyacid dehydrogenase